MNLFYKHNFDKDNFFIDKEESKHIIKVLRKRKGDIINFTDGEGFLFECKIVDDDINSIQIEVKNKYLQKKHDFFLHIAIAPTKNIERLEWFIEKSTEINIDEITPLICKNSERKFTNQEKLHKKIVSASKQSLTYYFPKLNRDISYNEFIDYSKSLDAIKLIAHCQEDKDKFFIEKFIVPKRNYIILIGPEGDFRKEEISLAVKNGFSQISLGTKRLRTETAGLLCVNYINIVNQYPKK